jgi:hypothetical protein
MRCSRPTDDDERVSMAGIFVGVGLFLFLVFLDRCVRRLRPVMVASLVARAGRESMRAVAAVGSAPARPETRGELHGLTADPPDLIVRSDRAGAIGGRTSSPSA